MRMRFSLLAVGAPLALAVVPSTPGGRGVRPRRSSAFPGAEGFGAGATGGRGGTS